MRHGEGFSRSGILTLTADHLRFRGTAPGGAEGTLRVGLAGIQTATFRAELGLLTLLAGEETYRFSGPGAQAVHTRLPALLGLRALKLPPPPAAPPPPPPPPTPVRAWPGALRHGIVAHPGELQPRPEGLHFHLTGRLDALVGVRPFTLPWVDLVRATLRGWPELKLELSLQEGEQRSFTLRDLPDRWAELPGLLHAGLARLLTEPMALSLWVDAVLRRWPEHLSPKERADALLHTPALQVVHDRSLRIGVLVLTRSRVLFLPAGGPQSGETAWTSGLARIARRSEDHRDASWICFDADRSLIELRPAGGEADVQRFWAHCRAPSRILSWDAAGRHTLERTTSSAAFIRLRADGVERVTLRPGQALRHVSGWGVIVPAEQAEPLLAAERISVEIGQFEAVYQFDSRAIRAAPAPPSFPSPFSGEAWLVICSWPDELRIYNQREEVRVPVSVEGQAWVVGEGELGIAPAALVLQNLSRGGFAAQIDRSLRVGTRLDCTIQGPEEPFTCVAEVRRSAPMPGDEHLHLIGCRLEQIPRPTEDQINRIVLRAQRAGLASPHSPDPDASVL